MAKDKYRIAHKYSHWYELNEEQLIQVKSIQARCTDEIEQRLFIFLYLNNLKLCKDAPDAIREQCLTQKNGIKLSTLYAGIEMLHEYASDNIVFLEEDTKDDHPCNTRARKKGKKQIIMTGSEELLAAVKEYTEWVYEDHSLVQLPMQYITLNGHKYKFPDAMLANNTYQQFTAAQRDLDSYFKTVETADKLIRETGNPDHDALQSLASTIKDAQRSFCANIMTAVANVGETRYDNTGKPYVFTREVAKYNADDYELYNNDMSHMPEWMFPLLFHFWQCTMALFKKKFPDLFTDSGENKTKDAFLAEVGTVNIMIEKGGYNNSSSVYDENVIFVLKRLDMMNEEARITKQQIEKSRQKRR